MLAYTWQINLINVNNKHTSIDLFLRNYVYIYININIFFLRSQIYNSLYSFYLGLAINRILFYLFYLHFIWYLLIFKHDFFYKKKNKATFQSKKKKQEKYIQILYIPFFFFSILSITWPMAIFGDLYAEKRKKPILILTSYTWIIRRIFW